ncbi:MAG TPA: glycerophosphodiester phosphodiesterase family protein [Longimicrobiales bacterium]
MIVIAHRGASAYAPEHTFASWDRARDMGADYLEQDLQMTSDGVLVVLHDETLDRTARRDGMPVRGRVIDHSLADLRSLEVGSWKSAEFTGEPIPTLEEVLKRYPDANFYIETKKPEEAPGMEEALLALLADFDLLEPARREWRVLIQSFSEASLRKIHAADPGLPLIQLLHRGWSANRDLSAAMAGIATYAVGVGPQSFDVDAAFMAAAHAHCLDVHPYTVDDPAEMQRLTEIGVDGIFTNMPDRLLATRPADELRGSKAVRAAAQLNRHCRDAADHGNAARRASYK